MKRIAIYILAVCSLVACSDPAENSGNNSSTVTEEYSSKFLSQTQIGIVEGEKMIKQFDEQLEQIIFDDNRTIFVVSDIDYSAYYAITFGGGIYLDNSLTVNLEAVGLSGVKNIEANVKVVKVDSSDQRYWLWDSDLSIGFIVDFSI